MKKYELVHDLTTAFGGRTLYRIRALTTFSNFAAGDLGGWIEKEDCLSQHGDSMVFGDATVSGNADLRGSDLFYAHLNGAVLPELLKDSGSAEVK